LLSPPPVRQRGRNYGPDAEQLIVFRATPGKSLCFWENAAVAISPSNTSVFGLEHLLCRPCRLHKSLSNKAALSFANVSAIATAILTDDLRRAPSHPTISVA